ncbi:MAG: hypothetical protein JWP29_4832 [Rhodoferax sp.]|nr:hypothetical protein [Rhodoferax sp.]
MDFASLGIKINTDAVRDAAADLDKLATSGAKAEVAAGKLADAGKAASGGFANTSDAIKKARASTDDYIRSQTMVIATQGQSANQSRLTELALKGATSAQLQAVAANQKLIDGYQRGVSIGESFNKMVKRSAVALTAAAAAAAYFFQKTVDGIADYKDLGEKIGDSAENIASLQKASDVSGKSLDDVANFSIKLTKALSKTDDEAKIAGRALEALGLNLKDFKARGPVDQIEALAKALDGFKDGPEKTAVLEALAKGSANLIPFFNDLADGAERSVRLTDEQITQADEYSKRQARLKSDLSAFAQVAVAESLPAIVALTGAFTDAAKEAFGLDGASTALGQNQGVKEFATSAATVLANIADGAFAVVQVFRYLGDNIGATAAQAVALAKLDFAGAAAIGRASIDFNDKFTFSLGLADKLEKRLATVGAAAKTVAAVKPRIDTSNLVTPGKSGKSSNSAAEQAAKAQLAFDIDMEKKAGEARVDAFANSERILEAQRSAGLLKEADYYAKKRQFLVDTTAAQEDAIRQEIARYQAEKATVTNKAESIRIDQKIFDSEAQLSKLRAKSTTDLTILAVQEKAVGTARTNAYKEAEAAAASYFRTVAQQNSRDLDGMGKGNTQREIDARVAVRESQIQSSRDALSGQLRAGQITQADYKVYLDIQENAHQQALASDAAYWAKKAELQASWSLGAQEGLTNYFEQTRNVYDQMQKVGESAFKGLEDAVVDFTRTGKLSFTSFADSVVSDIMRIIVRQQITGPLANVVSGSLKGATTDGNFDLSTLLSSVFSFRASGGPVSAGGLYQVNEKGPEVLNVAGKQFLMMGDQGGSVDPNKQASAPTIVQHNTFVVNGPIDKRTQSQIAAQAGTAARRAVARNT